MNGVTVNLNKMNKRKKSIIYFIYEKENKVKNQVDLDSRTRRYTCTKLNDNIYKQSIPHTSLTISIFDKMQNIYKL